MITAIIITQEEHFEMENFKQRIKRMNKKNEKVDDQKGKQKEKRSFLQRLSSYFKLLMESCNENLF